MKDEVNDGTADAMPCMKQQTGSGLSIRMAESEEDRQAILRLRELVYVKEQGRLQDAGDLEENVFGKFQSSSTYFVAFYDNAPVGTIRVIADSEVGLPCERNVCLAALRQNGRLVEFGHFITLPAFRAKGLGLLLLREAFGYSAVCLNATHILADIFADDASLLGPKYFLARGFTQLGDIYSDHRFSGSPRSMVVVLDVKEGMKLRERASAVEAYRRRYFAAGDIW